MKTFSRRRMGSWLMTVAAAGHVAVLALAAEPVDFDARFTPAFLAPSRLHLSGDAKGGTLDIEVGKTRVSVPVPAELMKNFEQTVQQIALKPANYAPGLDGCDMNLRLSLAGREVFSSHVWSPSRRTAPAEDALLRALHGVVDQSPLPRLQQAYLEMLFGWYMDGVQPFWKKSTAPDGSEVVRLRGTLSSDDIPAFRNLVQSLAADRPTVFDITSLGATGTLFHEEILKASKQRSMRWRAHPPWAELLRKIGVANDTISEVKELE